IFFQDMVGGNKNSVSIPYNATQYQYRRIRHESGTDLVNFETSADNVNWTIQRSIPRQLKLTAMHIELDGGTYQAVSAPGIGIYDDFHLDSIYSTQTAWTKRGE